MKKLLNQAWTVIMVSVITMLVWLYAEDANVKSYPNERVFVRFVAPDGGEMIIDPPGATVLVTLTGSNGQFQQFSRRVDEKKVLEIPVPISPGQPIATVSVDMRKELEEGLLGNLGLNLTDLEDQAYIDVTAQRIETVPISVHVIADGIDLVGPAEPSVEQVTIRVPASRAAEAKQLGAYIDLTAANLDSVVPGAATRLSALPIILPEMSGLPEGFEMRPSATEATVSFRMVVQRETYTIERLHVKLTSSASVSDRYAINIPAEHQFLGDIEVQGPPAQIALLRENPGSPNILATVELSNAEADEAAAGDGVVTKPVLVFINLPGVRLMSEPPRVPVEVRAREAGPATP